MRASSYGKPYAGGSNGPQRGYKQGLFDGGMHVPAIVRVPGQYKTGTGLEPPMISMDLLPTFMALADPGTPPPAGIDSQDILRSSTANPRLTKTSTGVSATAGRFAPATGSSSSIHRNFPAKKCPTRSGSPTSKPTPARKRTSRPGTRPSERNDKTPENLANLRRPEPRIDPWP